MTYLGEFLYRDDDPYECPDCTALVRDVGRHRAVAHPESRKDQI